MREYDAIIIGGATCGSYLARRLSESGARVLVLEKKDESTVGARYDIFHLPKGDFARFNLPEPVKGEDWAFEFSSNDARSAFGRYPKHTEAPVVGMHMHEYTLRMNRWALAAGAEIEYETAFSDFLLENGAVCGVRCEKNGRTEEIRARIVIDCSGIASVARRALPDGYGVERFEITPDNLFFVVLRYSVFKDSKDYVTGSRGWTFFKAWEAPSGNPKGAIYGIGANGGFEKCEKYYEQLCEVIELPEHTVEHIERGVTPYRRPPYSFVADGFVACGDAACLTKPSCGEGVTAAMVQADILCEVLMPLLAAGAKITRQALWPVNKRYYDGQGKVFAGQLATLADAVNSNAVENEFFFKNDIVFSQKTFESMGNGEPLSFSGGEMLSMALKMVWGVLTFRVRISTIKGLLRGMKNGDVMSAHYATYPQTPDGFAEWTQKADALWSACGSMSESSK